MVRWCDGLASERKVERLLADGLEAEAVSLVVGVWPVC